jgi:hypothetical protein
MLLLLFYRVHGSLLLSGEERAERERQRAEQEQQKRQRLAANQLRSLNPEQLKALGIELENLE